MMAWGVEARVPFLEVEFLDVAMRMDARHKMVGTRADGTRRIEKAVLREAFAGVLPDEILWRQKEQFSDGVGYGWIDGLRAHAERQVGDEAFAAAATGFPVNPPQTKEAYWRSEEHTSELQSLMRISYAVFCLKKKKKKNTYKNYDK